MRDHWLRVACWLALCLVSPVVFDKDAPAKPAPAQAVARFQTSDRCVACHNGLSTSAGDDLSIGLDWRVTLMANSSRDPYWQASVRRETVDHPGSAPAIEDECASCHMPIPRYRAKQRGELGAVFEHLPLKGGSEVARQAADGVSCSVCHQITAQKLGTAASFNAGFVVAGPDGTGVHAEYGPFDIDAGVREIMRSSTGGFEPRQAAHIRSSELCASCHTLVTQALGPQGEVIGTLPEQMPYQEWLHSDFRATRSCQGCHMPLVDEQVAISRVLGEKRAQVRRHQFLGANFLIQRMLSRYHLELGDETGAGASQREMADAAARTVAYLQSSAATITVSQPVVNAGRIEAQITVHNLGGHKLPTAYPSRRAWLHVILRDHDGRKIFESGALNADGSIQGNDNDENAGRFEPHYEEIRTADQVQIYEAVLGTKAGGPTTALLAAVGYLKDNRLLPNGFDKASAAAEIAVRGEAAADPGFTAGGHALGISVVAADAVGPFTVEAELLYQPVGFRWARNLEAYGQDEPQRFTVKYRQMASSSAVVLASATSGEAAMKK